MMASLSYKAVRKLLSYNPETGVFRWKRRPEGLHKKVKTWNSRFAGAIAGTIVCPNPSATILINYVHISVFGSMYFAHRLAFCHVTGKWPVDDVDHIDGDGTNNRWINLRQATPSQNAANRRCTFSSLGIKGVCQHRGKYQAQIKVHGKSIYLGRFTTPEEASAAYAAAAIKHFGEYAHAS